MVIFEATVHCGIALCHFPSEQSGVQDIFISSGGSLWVGHLLLSRTEMFSDCMKFSKSLVGPFSKMAPGGWFGEIPHIICKNMQGPLSSQPNQEGCCSWRFCKIGGLWGYGVGGLPKAVWLAMVIPIFELHFDKWSRKWKRQLFGYNIRNTLLTGYFPKALKCTSTYYYCFLLFPILYLPAVLQLSSHVLKMVLGIESRNDGGGGGIFQRSLRPLLLSPEETFPDSSRACDMYSELSQMQTQDRKVPGFPRRILPLSQPES